MDAALEQAARGRPALVVIEADAGMGKSTLIDAFLAGCGDDVTARRFAGADSEQDIPFGIAGLILREDVPSTWSGVEVGRRLLAWLSALQEGTAQDVVVLVVDDAQWMDRESAQALRFVLRRLSADRVLVVIAQRPAPRAGGSRSPCRRARWPPRRSASVRWTSRRCATSRTGPGGGRCPPRRPPS